MNKDVLILEMNNDILPNGNRLLTLPEVAQIIRVSIKTVRRMIDDGKLHSIKVRGARRVWLSDLMAYLEPAEKPVVVLRQHTPAAIKVG
jgi:excisionase family DNA binding protein